MERYGYLRVSSKDQNIARQLDEMISLGILRKQLFIDHQSGKDFNRPAYQKMKRKLRKGDLLVVKSIDRLGRNYREIGEEWRVITRVIQADVQVLDMPLLNTANSKDLLGTLISDLVLQLLSFVAENERQNIKQRQAEGIASAKRRGVKFGRPEIPLPEQFKNSYELWIAREITLQQAAKQCGLAKTTFYDKAQKIRNNR